MFFGLHPPSPARETIFAMGRRFKARHALVGPEMADHTLHLSLHRVAASSDEAAWMVIDACRAMEAVMTPVFEVRFDRVVSWKGKAQRRPLVLIPDARSNAALTRLWTDIGAALRAAGLPASPTFEPHVTLGRYPDILPEQVVEPVSWTIDSFNLIWSHYGQGRHSVLHRALLSTGAQGLGLSAP